jgi:hypothetical protein
VELTETQLEILSSAWALHARGCGLEVEDEYVPDTDQLAELGWLERRLDGDELTWWWTGRAETALQLNALTTVEGRPSASSTKRLLTAAGRRVRVDHHPPRGAGRTTESKVEGPG